ncbi:MAG: hypothetical protein A2Y02_00075 [Omnitrophica bacterium GWA2_52_12]|nr:MAG: hypothetical protein A2Y02_00075 [Omnitrophica bacterium GWA2_52_12]
MLCYSRIGVETDIVMYAMPLALRHSRQAKRDRESVNLDPRFRGDDEGGGGDDERRGRDDKKVSIESGKAPIFVGAIHELPPTE